jgi:hypothetical protein
LLASLLGVQTGRIAKAKSISRALAFFWPLREGVAAGKLNAAVV